MTELNNSFDNDCHQHDYQREQEAQQQQIAQNAYQKATSVVVDKLLGADPGYDKFDAECALQRMRKNQGIDVLQKFLETQILKLQGVRS